MSLLDSVLGSVMGSQQPQAGAAAGAGGFGSLIAMVASNPQVLHAITGMLSNDGGQGGLGGLMAKFQQAGLGDAASSWVGSGENHAVTGEQMSSALGEGTISDLAAKIGMSNGDAAGSLAGMLPGLIDKLTPHGAAPAGGLGNSGDLMGMLGGLLQKR
jgi:uncharacterized protein YidB (DUF937 family)